MKVVVQRTREASVTIDGERYSEIGKGMLILLGITEGDTEKELHQLVKKVADLRIFDDSNGVMNLSIKEVEGDVMVVSQFTLLANTRKGNRPSYIKAARPEVSEPLYRLFCNELSQALGKRVQTGVFGADMQVNLTNDGPVTIIMDTEEWEAQKDKNK